MDISAWTSWIEESCQDLCMNGKVARKRSACQFKGRTVADSFCTELHEEESCTEICAPPFQLFCPSYKDNLCCQGNGSCKDMQGPCEIDSDCEGSLICGTDNCPWAAEGVNCCKEKCQAEGCCYQYNRGPCKADEGVCDRYSDCIDGHTCLAGGCSWDNSSACCINQTLNKVCNQQDKCLEGEGHCNLDDGCQEGLNCTDKSCKWYHPNQAHFASCCNKVPG